MCILVWNGEFADLCPKAFQEQLDVFGGVRGEAVRENWDTGGQYGPVLSDHKGYHNRDSGFIGVEVEGVLGQVIADKGVRNGADAGSGQGFCAGHGVDLIGRSSLDGGIDAALQRFRETGQIGLAGETGDSLIGKLNFIDSPGLGKVSLTGLGQDFFYSGVACKEGNPGFALDCFVHLGDQCKALMVQLRSGGGCGFVVTGPKKEESRQRYCGNKDFKMFHLLYLLRVSEPYNEFGK